MSETVPIKVETLKSFADEARRLGETESELSTDEMIGIFENTKILPSAEEAFFGTQTDETVEYSITAHSWVNYATNKSGQHYGSDILVNETFSLKGFRMARYNNITAYIKLWDADSLELLKEVTASVKYSDMNDWTEYLLPTPITLVAGKRYTISVAGTNAPVYHPQHSVTTNPKVSYERGMKIGPSDQCPVEVITDTDKDRISVGLMMGPAQAEAIAEYKVQTGTMDDIADEVKRITGASGTLTTAQIITALQGIASTA